MTICGISIKRNKLQCKLEGKSLAANSIKIVINVSYKIQIKFVKLFLWYFYKENNLTWRKRRRTKILERKLEKKKKKQKPREPPIPPGVLDTRSAG